jgi:ribosomal-protein-alanine N-acetyltransferase
VAERSIAPPFEPAPPVRIRRLAYPDLPQVMAIERRVFPTPWSLAMFVLELSKPRSVCLAAQMPDNTLGGFLICSRYDRVWHLMNVAVDPKLRRRGIATALLEAADAETRAAGGRRLVLHAQTYARSLYERAGYVPRGHAFREAGIEHIAMEKELF